MISKSLSFKDAKLLYNEKAIDGLHGIDLELKQGEILGLMGPSGCGKSTLAKVIAGKLSLSAGIFEHNFENIFYLEESLLFENKSVLENFVHYAHGDTQNQKITRARMACSDLEITNYINTQICDLSTGQRQRVLLGLALVANSDLIILDEPFSHLEAPLKRELLEILLPLFRELNSTLIWISHDQQLILQYAGKVSLMNYGKIIQTDSPYALYFKPNSLFSTQFLGEYNVHSYQNKQISISRPENVLFHANEQAQFKLVEQVFMGNFYRLSFEDLKQTQVIKASSFTRLETQTNPNTKFELNFKEIHIFEN